ncbi:MULTISPECIES: TetR/AcrR family transcriptional regulator [Saccharothrix]|uniref:TetR family transcriptional regulator n=1 Tax=Saccharothrix yanglingensis TaxID=659496 RepID=A0ABU0WSX2_9PSEU|nr:MULTISPECIES: TetR family transcriptional regulator [Saccharothrix]MBY8848082.1 TetR family transcriptional regulator [Saccharothrix sp. MB29]MDQ2582852.1 TetR family transcriptional regulator [Saccharothrix yanglingensis]MDU0291845.1 TetR family transcriptional regulator [Saccharothrix longispora]
MTAATPKGERRRQALVEAAAGLLATGGFDAIRHRAVAERAGLPLASTTYYFDSLEDLVTAALEHHGNAELAYGKARLDELDPGGCNGDALIDLVLDLLLGPVGEGDAEAVLLRYERLVATGRRPYLRPLMRRMSVQLHDLLFDIFTRTGQPVTRERVEELIALVDGAVVNALIEISPDPRAAARRMLEKSMQPR